MSIDQDNSTKENIGSISLSDEMKKSYLDYAMSVIVSRALPDVRDGLKPVHRRILYSMSESGYFYNKAYKKSARIVGDVMGKFHPHGDAAIYDSMVRMAQNFSMRLELIDGQGNFGSMDGDRPAAMRYTEARLAKVTDNIVSDLDKETVDFNPNYDDSTIEPSVLPAQFPNLLVNGSGGIAVGMATQIAPHNLTEVINATLHLIDNPDCEIEDINNIILGPDFPTGGQIIGTKGITEYFETGKGSCVIRAKTSIEEFKKDRESIIIDEIPYQVNKSRLIEKIAETVNNKIIEGISDIRDESDRKGVRIVIELKRDVDSKIILNQLFKHTLLQSSFNSNMLALYKGRPEQLNIKQLLLYFISFREEIVTKRTIFELNKSRAKAHVFIGLVVANENIDQIINLIKESKDSKIAKENLKKISWKISKNIINFINIIESENTQLKNNIYNFSEEQAKAILELRLHRLTGLEREEISADLSAIIVDIKKYLEILNSRSKLLNVIKSELNKINQEFGTPRKTEIITKEYKQEDEIKFIQKEDIVITISNNGYIKRSLLVNYRSQNRGGKGKTGMSTREDDFVKQLFIADTHTKLLIFSSIGKVYKLNSYSIPEASLKARGKPIVNLLPFSNDEKIATIVPLPINEDNWKNLFLIFSTKKGMVRKNNLNDVAKSGKKELRETGKMSIKLLKDDELIGANLTNDNKDIFLTTSSGKFVRFPVYSLSTKSGLNTQGNKSIFLDNDNFVVSSSILKHSKIDIETRNEYLKFSSEQRKNNQPNIINEQFLELQKNEEFIMTVTSNGFGKRSSAYHYRILEKRNTNSKGSKAIEVTNKTGKVVDSFIVNKDDQIILVSDKGKIIRVNVNQIRIAGRSTQGVSIFNIPNDEKIVSISRVQDLNEDEEK
ncbi:MAG: DNA gyrase subunit A [Alphaproteobacteria bacterium MarineAlpha5_Bin9]|nr:MAG: DNA gyrase subunit A [Alphaproteobacteria bacterium MarineAlpha5_Bin9]